MREMDLVLTDAAMDVADAIEGFLKVLPNDERPLRNRLAIAQTNLILYAQRNTA